MANRSLERTLLNIVLIISHNLRFLFRPDSKKQTTVKKNCFNGFQGGRVLRVPPVDPPLVYLVLVGNYGVVIVLLSKK